MTGVFDCVFVLCLLDGLFRGVMRDSGVHPVLAHHRHRTVAGFYERRLTKYLGCFRP